MSPRLFIAGTSVVLFAATVRAGEPSASAKPFAVRLAPGYAAVAPGEEFPVAVILDIAEHHKVYQDSIRVQIPKGASGRVASVREPPALTRHDPYTGAEKQFYTGRAIYVIGVEAPAATGDAVELRLEVGFRGCSESVCFLPETRELVASIPLRRPGSPSERTNQEYFAAAGPSPQPGDFTRRGLLFAVLASFGLGVLLSLTPCVYPLIPVTIAVIGGGAGAGGWRKGLLLSLVYVFGLSLTYAVLGALAATGGSSFGAVSGNPAVVAVVAVLFLALAISLFGVYDLQVPARWQAKLRLRRGGGPLGVCAMGMLSGLVASPCVAAPIASVLLYIATTGNTVRGALMLFAMAWGMGLILVAAGTFSGLFEKLPKAGGWMVGVKTALGAILVVAALYFLRPVMPAAVFTPWIAVPLAAFGLWRGVYVKGGPGDSKGRLALRAVGIVAFIVGTYLGVGALIGGGMPAPLLDGLYPQGVRPALSKITFRTDLEAAREEARREGRPVMIDFVLPDCAGCVELEHHVFSRDEVASALERFVKVRVDLDAPPLPLEELRARYRVFGAPSVVLIDSSGEVRYDLTITDGGTPAEEFLRRVRQVR